MSDTGQQIAQRTPQETLAMGIRSEQFRSQIEMALPANVTVDRFTRALLTAVMTNPDIAKADHQSVILASIRCAQDGLLPDGKQAAIAVFGGKATYMPMIGGLRVALADFGWTLVTRAVYQGDEFDFSEQPPEIKHKPTAPGARGELAYAYAIATHRDGRRLQRVVFPDEVEARRKVAKTQNIWKLWPAEMWEKTAGRILFDEIPLSELDEQRSRLASIVSAWEGDPGKAVDAIYGPAQRQLVDISSARELTEASSALEPPVEAGADTPVSEQAGGGAAETPATAAGSSPTPEPPLEPALDGEPQITFGVPAAAVEAAAATVVGSQGITVDEILGKEDPGEWVRWAVQPESSLAEQERDALLLVVKERRPELLTPPAASEAA